MGEDALQNFPNLRPTPVGKVVLTGQNMPVPLRAEEITYTGVRSATSRTYADLPNDFVAKCLAFSQGNGAMPCHPKNSWGRENIPCA